MKTELRIAVIRFEHDGRTRLYAEPQGDRTDEEMEKRLDAGEEIVFCFTVPLKDDDGNADSRLAPAYQAIESIDALGNTPQMQDLLMHILAEGVRAAFNAS